MDDIYTNPRLCWLEMIDPHSKKNKVLKTFVENGVMSEFVCSNLPKGFILSGDDALYALMTHPDVLAADNDIPGLELAGYQLRIQDYPSLLFWPVMSDFHLGIDEHPAKGQPKITNGLSFIG